MAAGYLDFKPPKEIPPSIADLAEMLESIPLHSPRVVENLFKVGNFPDLALPDSIRVHCDHERCGGVRRHGKVSYHRVLVEGSLLYYFTQYDCSNCRDSHKYFALKVELWKEDEDISGSCTKIYQDPPFGPAIPKRLYELIGEENRVYFLQARRAIARGLGVGAYAYYRRIVENTKFDLVSSVLAIARATNAPPGQIELLQRAQSENQFSKAFEMLREASAVPAVLLMEGHNPLTLLHDLLSEGIHKYDDAECLARAQDAEVILCELAVRMDTALAERKALRVAITSTINRKPSASAGAG